MPIDSVLTILQMLASVAVGTGAIWIARSQAKSSQSSAESTKAQVQLTDLSLQAELRAAKSEAERREREQWEAATHQRLADTELALSIHRELTSRDLLEAELRTPKTAADARFLTSTLQRCATQYASFESLADIDRQIMSLIDAELHNLIGLTSAHDETMEAAEVIDTKIDRTDFLWTADQPSHPGQPPYRKIEILVLIGRQYAATEAITSRKDFQTRFGAEIATAVGSTMTARLDPARLLIDADQASDWYCEIMARVGSIRLDDADWLIDWWCGCGTTGAVGKRIHRPIIRHFRNRGYPIKTARTHFHHPDDPDDEPGGDHPATGTEPRERTTAKPREKTTAKATAH